MFRYPLRHGGRNGSIRLRHAFLHDPVIRTQYNDSALFNGHVLAAGQRGDPADRFFQKTETA